MAMSGKREGIVRAYLHHYNGKDGRKERRIDRARRKEALRRERSLTDNRGGRAWGP